MSAKTLLSYTKGNVDVEDHEVPMERKGSDPDSLEHGKESQKYLERRALWKLDLTIIPIVAMFYLLSFLDRSNFGNARIAGLQTYLNLSDHQYYVALTVTYIPYIMAEIPSNLLLKRIGANYFLPAIVTIWGVITASQGFVRSYPGLVAARFFLGLVEGGMFPGIVLYLSFFYTRRELQFRIALFYSAASLSGAFSGLLAYVIIRLDGKGGQPGWAWIFILEGLATSLWGIISFFIFPASIETSKFLTASEKIILKARLTKDIPLADGEPDRFTAGEFFRVLKSPHVLILCASVFMSGTTTSSLAYFQPTIVHSMGYSASLSQLMSVPPFAVSFFVMLFTAYVSDRYLGRGIVAIMGAFVGMIGFLLFYVAGEAHRSLKYGSLFLSVSGAYSVVPAIFAWQSNNSEPHYRHAVAIALASMAGNAGGILGTWIFPQSEKPRYRTGTMVNLFFCAGMIVASCANLIWLRAANQSKIRNRQAILLKYPGHDDVDVNDPEKNLSIRQKAIKELGDQHPDFEYIY